MSGKGIGIGLLLMVAILSSGSLPANAGAYRLARYVVRHAESATRSSAKAVAKTARATGRAIKWLAY